MIETAVTCIYSFVSTHEEITIYYTGVIAIILFVFIGLLVLWGKNYDGYSSKKRNVSDRNVSSTQNHDSKDTVDVTSPTSVNYHFTRQCNYQCGFCFHTAKTSDVLPLEEAKHGLKMLKDTGMFSILKMSF